MALFSINLQPDRRTLRVFGIEALLAFAVLGTLVYAGFWGVVFGSTAGVAACLLWALGLLAGLLAIVAPGANRPLYVALVVITYPVGFVLSHVLLAVVFFGLITPLGLLFRLTGRDPLHRRFDRQAKTYWVPHRPADRIERYFRQF